ncbi:MAG: hypothetical protein Q8O81_02145 [Giesbergeria sp.]|nr:hypothetical protein [Giesbergeria sp.]
MAHLHRTLKALGWMALVTGVLAAIGLGVLIAANWRDDPLSEAAQQALRYTPPTEQALEDNGYLILLGLDAPIQGDAVADAVALGRQRLAREIERRRWVEAHGDTADRMPPSIQAESSGDGVLPVRLRCPADGSDCFDWYDKHRAEIDALVQANLAQLQRLKAAASTAQFSNPAPFYLLAEFPPYARLARAHELWLTQASLQWTSGQPLQALDITRQAVQLRSRLAHSSNNLIASMIALAMQCRELRWLSDASAHLTQQMPVEVSKSLEELLATPPPSLHSAFEGEKQFVASISFSQLDPNTFRFFTSPWIEHPAWWQHMLHRGRVLAFLPQQSLNLSIKNLQKMQALSDLPAHQLEAAFSNPLRKTEEDNACDKPWMHLRNGGGLCLAAIAMSSHTNYIQRIADLDGYRRLVLLQHRAAAQRVAPEDMPTWLAKAPQELRNPYTLQPMQWDTTTGSLIFEGREPQNQNPGKSPVYRIHLPH